MEAEPARRGAPRRGVIHVHTHHSYDGIASARQLLRMARREGLAFLIVTDHDTLDGSREVRDLAVRQGGGIEVPLAAEYRTDHGDVIAAFLEREVAARGFDDVVAEVRGQNGLLMLPHPYSQHRDVERLARAVDLIEIHNARVSDDRNAAARELARALNKPGYVASDAHMPWNLAKAVVEVNGADSLRDALRAGSIRATRSEQLGALDVAASQLLKAVRTRDARLFTHVLLRPPYRVLRRLTVRQAR